MSAVDKWTVARVLDEIAQYTSLSDPQRFRSRAFERAARAIEKPRGRHRAARRVRRPGQDSRNRQSGRVDREGAGRHRRVALPRRPAQAVPARHLRPAPRPRPRHHEDRFPVRETRHRLTRRAGSRGARWAAGEVEGLRPEDDDEDPRGNREGAAARVAIPPAHRSRSRGAHARAAGEDRRDRGRGGRRQCPPASRGEPQRQHRDRCERPPVRGRRPEETRRSARGNRRTHLQRIASERGGQSCSISPIPTTSVRPWSKRQAARNSSTL